MENMLFYIFWTMFAGVSFWGLISLSMFMEVADSAYKKFFVKRKSDLRGFVMIYRANSAKFMSLLFFCGLAYLENINKKTVYFIFSTMAVLISFVLWIKMEASAWSFWFSISLLFFNIMFYYGARHDMKRFT